MKKSFIALAIALSTSAAFAGQPAHEAKTVSFEIGATTHSELYEEFDETGKFMQEKGRLYGIKGSMTRHFGPQTSFTLAGEYAVGKATYTGAYWGGNYGDLVFPGLSRNMLELTAVAGHRPTGFEDTKFTAGLGYRRLTDNLQESGDGGYKRVNDLTYAIIGVEQAFHVSDWSISPGLRYKHLLAGNQFSDLWGGVNVRQKTGSGGDVYVNFLHKPTGILISPYMRTWSVADSEISEDGLYEPRNKTKEVGVSLSYRF